MHRIEAELLIPGRGGPVHDGVVVLDGARISYAGPAGVAPATPGTPVTWATTVMPGMWECHGHLIGTRTFDLGQLPLEPEALRAGVRTIEHGTYLDDECCDAMRETDAILVPTRTIIEDMLSFRDAVPPYAMAKLDAMADRHAQAVTRAYEHGVTIAMGTDIALTGPDRANAWGQNGSEPGYLVKLGMSPLEAIEAATASGPLTLGPQAPRSGQLAEGYDADVLTLDADPLADIGILADPARITTVWTRGRQVKRPVTA